MSPGGQIQCESAGAIQTKERENAIQGVQIPPVLAYTTTLNAADSRGAVTPRGDTYGAITDANRMRNARSGVVARDNNGLGARLRADGEGLDMIENCPICGGVPVFCEEYSPPFWRCIAQPESHVIEGPIEDPSGEKWNEMVRRLRRLRGQQQTTAYPERMRRLRRKLAEVRAEIEKRAEMSAAIDAELAEIAKLRDAIGEAWDRFEAASERLANAPVCTPVSTPDSTPRGMTWQQLMGATTKGDRATCGRFEPGWYIERTYGDMWGMTPVEKTGPQHSGIWCEQADWRILPRETADE